MKFQINKTSQLVTIKEDMVIQQLEEGLSAEGLTLGYYPAISQNKIFLFECLLRRVPNLFFTKYGGLPDLCAGISWTGHHSAKVQTKIYPRAATGPDLRRMFIGSEGVLGQVHDVTMRVFVKPEKTQWCILFSDKQTTLDEILSKMFSVMIQPLFVVMGDKDEAFKLCDGLKIKRLASQFMAVKLAGLSTMVSLEKAVLYDSLTREDKLVFTPGEVREKQWLDSHLLTPSCYSKMSKKYAHFFGTDTSQNKSSSQQIKKYFEEITC